MEQEPLNIYISATKQNDGKTTTALGLLNAIAEKYPRIGYIKPVGQQVQMIGDQQIDKDVSLMNEIYQIGGQLNNMSPVAIPRGFTEEFIRHGNVRHLEERIKLAYQQESRSKDFMVIEGTGHAGVGSVLELSNAGVARMLKSPVIIVTCGGIGRPIDEVSLNKAVFDQYDVPVLGVIVNKVHPEKVNKVEEIVRLGFKKKGLPVFGVIPFYSILSSPTMRQILEDSRGELLCGEESLDDLVSKVIVGAMPPHSALDYFKGEVLLITPGNRDDLILAAISCKVPGIQEEFNVKGIVLTGGIMPHPAIYRLVSQTQIPLISVKDDTFTAAQRITNMIVKIKPEAKEKINKVKEIIKQHVDIDEIVKLIKR
jgi:BioD-like phosphotransacetylase family protein